MRLVMDIETTFGKDGQLPDRTHCLCVLDVDTWEEWEFVDGAQGGRKGAWIEDGLALLDRAELLIGHNIEGFDIPVLTAHYDWEPTVPTYDTVLASRQIYFGNKILSRSIRAQKWAARGLRGAAAREAMEKKIPSRLLKWHSLEAWGYRLGQHKDSDWKTTEANHVAYSPRMGEYCMQDVRVNAHLFHHLTTRPAEEGWPVTPIEAIIAESAFARYLYQQRANGVGFDVDRAREFTAVLLTKKAEVVARLRETVKPWYRPNGTQTPKRSMESRKVKPGEPGYKNVRAGSPFTKVERVEFNPGSAVHVADRLITLYGWEPEEFSDTLNSWIAGELRPQPSTKSEIIRELDYPIVPDLVEYSRVDHLLGQLSEGKGSWLATVRDGVIHGTVIPSGARTSRCAHREPNVNVPRPTSPYGKECRELFRPTRNGWAQIGTDASGIELRMLGHYLWPWDNGAFAEVVLTGDVHEAFRKAAGSFSRDLQKNITYGLLYGAGDRKLGLLVIADWQWAFENGHTDEPPPKRTFAMELGRVVRERLLTGITGLDEFVAAAHECHRRRHVRAIDGRCIQTKSQHGTVNDILQSGAGIVMKYAPVIFAEEARARGWKIGREWAPMLHVHDEYQFEAPPGNADEVGALSVWAIEEAGRRLGVRIPLTGEYKIGTNWAETH